ncbi:hypothetical protein [Clostridium botulinum]|uniref:hypothetical protein n=1 Tax=Clostridium botulinum TaxID=1491 RepID=UPI000772F50D|nr:hypothetical protein [Clostridium botulinum]NFN46907.1 CopG family transcriptional regulator [Clostridium botulinum]
MIKKDEFIKIRVTSEQKELFKRVSKELGITMTELFVVGTEQLARRKLEGLKNKDIIENRISDTDNKLQIIKQKLLSKKK